MFQYYDKVVKGTEHEDALVIVQSLKGLIGEKFSFLNYYKEIPVSNDATLMNVENEMAEFSVHEYQAKVINIERKALIHSHPIRGLKEDMVGEAFYVSSSKKRVILCKFAYARIHSEMRCFVRVLLDRPLEAYIINDSDSVRGDVRDISLGGAAMSTMSTDLLTLGQDINLLLRLPEINSHTITEVVLMATVLRVIGENAPITYILKFHSDKHSLQQIAYYINQRQVEIIKELKDLNA